MFSFTLQWLTISSSNEYLGFFSVILKMSHFPPLDLQEGKSKHKASINQHNLCSFEEYKLFVNFK